MEKRLLGMSGMPWTIGCGGCACVEDACGGGGGASMGDVEDRLYCEGEGE